METPWKLLNTFAGLYFEGLEARKEGIKSITRRLAACPLPPLSRCLGIRGKRTPEYTSTPLSSSQNSQKAHN